MPWHSRISNAEPFWVRHRGPFVLCISRPHPKPLKARAGFYTSEWLKGSDEGAEAQAAAYALLTDPRDTVATVSVWSEREQSFSMNYRRADINAT